MSYDNSAEALTLPASGDLSAAQFKIVTVDANGRAAVANATSLNAGVLQNKPTALGQPACVVYAGVSKVKSGGVVAAGARVTADASGNAIAAAGAGDSVIGVALEGAASGDIFPILVGQYPFATLA